MKKLQKLILPLMILIIIFLIYSIYFSPQKGLGSFSDFDPNNNANKDIKVKIVQEKGITRDQEATIFYAVDKLIFRPKEHLFISIPERFAIIGHRI